MNVTGHAKILEHHKDTQCTSVHVQVSVDKEFSRITFFLVDKINLGNFSLEDLVVREEKVLHVPVASTYVVNKPSGNRITSINNVASIPDATKEVSAVEFFDPIMSFQTLQSVAYTKVRRKTEVWLHKLFSVNTTTHPHPREVQTIWTTLWNSQCTWYHRN